MNIESVGDLSYMKQKLLVWDISPLSPIKLIPWDLDMYQTVYRLSFQEKGYTSETAARVMVF